MPSSPKSYHQFQPEDLVTLASLRQQGLGVLAIAGILQRSPSTISRELQLKRELVACLRQARNKRTPRSKGDDRRGQIPDMLSIHLRPPEVEDRQFQGTGGATSSRARPTPVRRVSWWSAPAGC